jgi:hypothetical protein
VPPPSVLAGVRSQLLCILTELQRLVAMVAAGRLPATLAAAAQIAVPGLVIMLLLHATAFERSWRWVESELMRCVAL